MSWATALALKLISREKAASSEQVNAIKYLEDLIILVSFFIIIIETAIASRLYREISRD